jgi:hypothetical protein
LLESRSLTLPRRVSSGSANSSWRSARQANLRMRPAALPSAGTVNRPRRAAPAWS